MPSVLISLSIKLRNGIFCASIFRQQHTFSDNKRQARVFQLDFMGVFTIKIDKLFSLTKFI